MSHIWKIVPISGNQLLDVNESDLLANGHFRRCLTYKGGGGYDQFPYIAVELGLASAPDLVNAQFVVQLLGCNLDCPYCYVTREGVWGDFVYYDSEQLINEYNKAKISHGVNVFHLMGGAPGLQLKYWSELLDILGPGEIFHSDLMLSEGKYSPEVLKSIDRHGVLIAINIKGTDKLTWEINTRKPYDESLLELNINLIKEHLDPARWYITFTNIDKASQDQFLSKYALADHYNYHIDLINYNALPFVDSVQWGRSSYLEENEYV